MEKNRTTQNENNASQSDKAANHDERERASSGSWDDQRDSNETSEQSYDGADQNDNSGGAGSTGSAATNS